MATVTAYKPVTATTYLTTYKDISVPDEPSKDFTPGNTVSVSARQRIFIFRAAGAAGRSSGPIGFCNDERIVYGVGGGRVVSVHYDTANVIVDYGEAPVGVAMVTVSSCTVVAGEHLTPI
jgi:hypothetical protein